MTTPPARPGDASGFGILIGVDIDANRYCDGMDPSVMLSVIGRAPGGLSYWHIIGLLEGVAGKAEIAAMDLVEFMPERDIDGMGALTAGRVVATAMALIARQSAKVS